jgi:hypothetical protein
MEEGTRAVSELVCPRASGCFYRRDKIPPNGGTAENYASAKTTPCSGATESVHGNERTRRAVLASQMRGGATQILNRPAASRTGACSCPSSHHFMVGYSRATLSRAAIRRHWTGHSFSHSWLFAHVAASKQPAPPRLGKVFSCPLSAEHQRCQVSTSTILLKSVSNFVAPYRQERD